MEIIINPGSENKGGTLKQAQKNAKKWLKSIHDDGFQEVEISKGEKQKDGDYVFSFIHNITKKEAILDIHGFTEKGCKK